MPKRERRRKCMSCDVLFRPDPRNCRHQRYCSDPACRQVSKRASQATWSAKPENLEYFRGSIHVARVQAWRQAHPGYWRGSRRNSAPALQEDSLAQRIEKNNETGSLGRLALQDIFVAQPTVLIGLIAHITGSSLQDDIAGTSRQLLQLGQDILDGRRGRAHQADHRPGTGS